MRKKMNARVDRRKFAKYADKTKAINIPGKITMRGGIRL